MIKVKKPLNPTNYNLGYKIVEVTRELVNAQLGKPDKERNAQWVGCEIANADDIAKWGKKGQNLSTPAKVEKEVISELTESVAEVTEGVTENSDPKEKRKYKPRTK